MQIGPYTLSSNIGLAPMAGVTDQPFRQLCRRYGAGITTSEMIGSDPRLRNTNKSRLRSSIVDDAEPRSIQIAGSEPQQLAEAARYHAGLGAQIIDINMGCPAKKVCNKLAGSALLADEALVADILNAVVQAVDVPVTLKIRTGSNPAARNGLRIAQLAEQAGIAALAVHGRTRADLYKGQAEYDTIKAIKAAVNLPILANGDICTPQQAKAVLEFTGADGLLIGRAAQGQPWLFKAINHYLATGEQLPRIAPRECLAVMQEHLDGIYQLYGNNMGTRIARKHILQYLDHAELLPEKGSVLRQQLMQAEAPELQAKALLNCFASALETSQEATAEPSLSNSAAAKTQARTKQLMPHKLKPIAGNTTEALAA